MSTEIVPTPVSDTDVAAYLALLQAGGQQSSDMESDVDPNKLVPSLKMSKETKAFVVKLGEEVLTSAAFFYIQFVDVRGSRALFHPQSHPNKADYKSPICSTGLRPVGEFHPDVAHGNFVINKDFATPYGLRDKEGALLEHRLGEEVRIECEKCPYNKFESEPMWDSTKQTRGKACKESRLYLVRIMEKDGRAALSDGRGGELYFFNHHVNFEQPIRLNLTLGANKKSIDALIMAAKARRMALANLVLKVSVIAHSESGVVWAEFSWEIVGVPTAVAYSKTQAEDLAWCKAFLERHAKKLAAEVEAPF